MIMPMYNTRWTARMGAVVMALCAAAVFGAEKTGIDDSDLTVITSEKLTFDANEQYAVFEKNVEVTDPNMRITADKLTVNFDQDNKVKSITAEGQVVMKQADKTAWSDMASYFVESGKIILSGNPRVRRGRDVLEGGTITFWRDDNRMVCEPNARLVIYPEKGGTRDQLLGGE